MDSESRVSKVGWTRRCLASALVVASLLGWSASAQAAVYNVYTNSRDGNGAMVMNPFDGYCSLAEAIDCVNQGRARWRCDDAFPGSSPIIQFWAASGEPFADNPFVITSLTISKDVVLTGNGAYINSTATSGLVIGADASVELHGLTLAFTGTSGRGRLIHNSGELAIFASTLKNGNVTALSGQDENGGAIYNAGIGVISYLGVDVSFLGNKAKRGGAIYNDTGRIDNLRGLIQGNSATMAGGGIYNLSTASSGGPSNGIIYAVGATIMKNSAKAGGGVFNRGYFDMSGGSITLNTVGSGASGETCSWGSGQSCDGAGGGVVSAPGSLTLSAGLNTRDGVTISANTASGLGGAIYTAGQANLIGVTMVGNRALSGAAIYAAPQGSAYYCQIGATGQSATINNNTATAGYSILDGFRLDDGVNRQCLFQATTASGNSPWLNPPRYCNPSMVRLGSQCPQL